MNMAHGHFSSRSRRTASTPGPGGLTQGLRRQPLRDRRHRTAAMVGQAEDEQHARSGRRDEAVLRKMSEEDGDE